MKEGKKKSGKEENWKNEGGEKEEQGGRKLERNKKKEGRESCDWKIVFLEEKIRDGSKMKKERKNF